MLQQENSILMIHNLKDYIETWAVKYLKDKTGAEEKQGIIYLKPQRFPIQDELWNELTHGEKPPFAAFTSILPKLQKNHEEYICSIVERICRRKLRDDVFLREYMHDDKDAPGDDIKSKVLTLAKLYRADFESNGKDNIAAFFRERVIIDDRTDAWLAAPVWANIGITIDAGWEYYLNTVYPAYGAIYNDKEIEAAFCESSLVWLTRRQGYSQRQLQRALHMVKSEPDRIESKFLKSAAMEVWHELCDMNQLGFFLPLTLREVLLIQSMKWWGERQGKWGGYILISRDTRCGFFSTFEGSCSLLGIDLEKDVKVVMKDFDIVPDGTAGEAMYEICEGNIWTRGSIIHFGMPRKFRKEAAALGIDSDWLQSVQ